MQYNLARNGLAILQMFTTGTKIGKNGSAAQNSEIFATYW